jgi:hypothetical protein
MILPVLSCVQAIGHSAVLAVVEGADHALHGREQEGATAIANFIASLR